MTEEPGLQVRHTKRHDVALEAELRIASEHAGLVRFSGAAGAREDRLRVVIVDASVGGLGVMSPVFIPRRCVVLVRALDPRNPTGAALLEARLLVQRVRMTDRRPAYLLGTSFAPTDGAMAAEIERFMRMFESERSGAPEAGRARS